MPARWSRRSVLGLGLAGAAAILAGCSEDTPPERSGRTDPPPPTPDVPAPVPDVPALLAALESCRVLAREAAAITEARDRRGRVIEQALASFLEQERVLEEVLAAGEVAVPPDPAPRSSGTPPPVASGSPSQTPDAATSTTAPGDATTSTVDPAEQTRQEQERVRRVDRAAKALAGTAAQDISSTALRSLSAVSAANLAMLTSLAGQRGALVQALGADPGWPALPGPAGPVAAEMLPTFRAAVYALEVIAAREDGDEREVPERALGRLRRLTRELTALAGPTAPPAPLGYGIDTDLTTPGGRDDLARQVLSSLPPAVVAAAGAHTGDPDAVSGTVRLLADVVEVGSWWDLAMPPFPGMTVP